MISVLKVNHTWFPVALLSCAAAYFAIAPMPAKGQGQTLPPCLARFGNVTAWTGNFTLSAGGTVLVPHGSVTFEQALKGFPDYTNQTPLPNPPFWTGIDTDLLNSFRVTLVNPAGESILIPDPQVYGKNTPTLRETGSLETHPDCTYSFYEQTNFDGRAIGPKGSAPVPLVFGPIFFNTPNPRDVISPIHQMPLPNQEVELKGDMELQAGFPYTGQSTFVWHTVWNFYPACQVKLPQVFRQWQITDGAKHWGKEVYDTDAPNTIAAEGCALTSLTMALYYAGVSTLPTPAHPVLDPGALNTFLSDPVAMHNVLVEYWNTHGGGAVLPMSGETGFSGALLKFDVATRYATGFQKLKFNFHEADSVNGLDAAQRVLDEELCSSDPHPVIVAVTGSNGKYPGHYVVVTGRHNSDDGTRHYDITDPAYVNRISLDDYSNKFWTRGTVKDPPSDISALDLAVGGNATLLVTDASGKRAGFDPSAGQILQEIPGSSSSSDTITNDTGATDLPGHTPNAHLVQIFQPVEGQFVIVVNGVQNGPYSLDVDGFSADGSPQPGLVLKGMTWPGAASTYLVSFTKASLSKLNVQSLPGDRNGDGIVDCADLEIVRAAFGKRLGQPGYDPRADLNGDGVVNILDLSAEAKLMPAGTVCR